MRRLPALLTTALAPAVLMAAQPVGATAAPKNGDFATEVDADYTAHLEKLFLDFHRNPELSFKETRTAALMAKELRAIGGIEVTEKVGGTGVVGVMRNGAGPVILVRADMDGLPVKEDSGLPYSSTVTQVDIDGVTKPVMHACGHDVHITSLIGTARQLARMKKKWSGTIVFVVQPAEERIAGARRMMDDGLYTRFPKPDYALAFHVAAGVPAGKLVLAPGIAYSSSDSVDITVHGIGSHGASPHMGKDPIVMGSQIVMGLQTLVSREIAPLKAGVVTVGMFNAGLKNNIISDRAELKLTVRSDDEDTRAKLLAGIRRVAENVGRMNGMPEDKLPVVRIGEESVPTTVNDDVVANRVRAAFTRSFGADVLKDEKRQGMGAEDFAVFIEQKNGVPGAIFAVGGTAQEDLDAEKAGGKPVAAHHSPFFKVEPRPSVTMGTRAMTVAVLEMLGK